MAAALGDNLERQVSELEAVEAMYPDELTMDPEEHESLRCAGLQ